MIPEELKRRMRFTHPDDGVSVRNRQYSWKSPAYEIKNIRRNSEDPGSSTIYYEDTGGNKYKTNAQMFVERFGDFYIESSIKCAINLLAQVPGYDSPIPAVENENPASIPRSCPNCGYMAMGSDLSAAIEKGETDLKCPRCGFSINNAPDEKFLMAEKKMSKLKSAVHKLAQWKERVMDLSDELYFPSEEETEDPIMRRIREFEEELGFDPLDLADMPGMEEDYLAYLEDEAGMLMGAKKAQVLENLEGETKDYDAEILDGMARCFFVCAWAEFAEQELDANFSRMELMDVAPETPPESFEKAKRLYNDIENKNNVDLSTFTPPGIDPDEGFDKELFGHYLCMEAQGHGVSWKDDHEDHGLELPLIETDANMDFSEATLRQMYEEFDVEFPEDVTANKKEAVEYERYDPPPPPYGRHGPSLVSDTYKVKAILSKMRPGEEVDAWGMSREIEGVQPITVEQILNKLVEEGLVTKEGNWFAPVEGIDWLATEKKEDLERDGTWYSLVNEGR